MSATFHKRRVRFFNMDAMTTSFKYEYTVTYTDDAPCDIADAVATAELVAVMGAPVNQSRTLFYSVTGREQANTTEFLTYSTHPQRNEADLYMYAKFILDAVQWLRKHQGFKL